MPNPLIQSFASKAGKTVKEVDDLWNKAVEIAKSKGFKDDAMYAYATGVLKNMLGIKECLEVKTRCELIIEKYTIDEGKDQAGVEDGTGPYQGKDGKGKNKKPDCKNKSDEALSQKEIEANIAKIKLDKAEIRNLVMMITSGAKQKAILDMATKIEAKMLKDMGFKRSE